MFNAQVFSIERVVTLLTPFFAAGATALTGWLATHTGTHLKPSDVQGVEIAAFLGSVGIVAKWLHGRQIPEIAGLKITPAQVDQLHAEVEAYLTAHPQVEADVDKATAAVVDAARKQLLAGLVGPATTVPGATTTAA